MDKELFFEKAEVKTESEEKFGRNIEIHAIFIRHGEKGPAGELAEAGKKEAEKFGKSLETKAAIKGYTSPVKRVIETVEKIIEAAPHEKKLKTRIRSAIGLWPLSKKFAEEWKKREAISDDNAAEWYLSFGDKRPDPETWSPHETAEAVSYLLSHYIKIPERLRSDSDIDLINGTHTVVPLTLLKEALIREEKGGKVIGFENISEIGGALKSTEAIEFLITTDKEGKKNVKLNFRDHTYDIYLDKVEELAQSYIEKYVRFEKEKHK